MYADRTVWLHMDRPANMRNEYSRTKSMLRFRLCSFEAEKDEDGASRISGSLSPSWSDILDVLFVSDGIPMPTFEPGRKLFIKVGSQVWGVAPVVSTGQKQSARRLPRSYMHYTYGVLVFKTLSYLTFLERTLVRRRRKKVVASAVLTL